MFFSPVKYLNALPLLNTPQICNYHAFKAITAKFKKETKEMSRLANPSFNHGRIVERCDGIQGIVTGFIVKKVEHWANAVEIYFKFDLAAQVFSGPAELVQRFSQ